MSFLLKIFLIFIVCLIVTTIMFMIIEIINPYSPIFKRDKSNNNTVLIIIPIKLSYMASLACPVASKNDARGDSKENKINIGLSILK